MAIGPTEAALLKVGVKLLESTVPKGMSLIKNWWKGKKILIVGQGRAGKSTFVDYLRHGIFEGEKDTEMTPSVKSTGRFSTKLGNTGSLELEVQKVEDLPGQVGPVEHANLAHEKRPHAILVFIDLTSPKTGEKSAATWMKKFCERLELLWQAEGNGKNRLKSMVVVMNKRDSVNDADEARVKKQLGAIVESQLKIARARMTDAIPVRPCIMVTNPKNKEMVDSIVAHVIKILAS